MKGTFTVRGEKFRTASTFRFVVVACRPATFEGRRWDGRVGDYVPETFAAFAPRIIRRSDSLAKAYDVRRAYGHVAGGFVAIVDTHTGEEV